MKLREYHHQHKKQILIVQSLISYFSSTPKDREWGIGAKEGAKWQYECKKTVLSSLHDHCANGTKEQALEALKAIGEAYKHPDCGTDSDFEKQVDELIGICVDCAGEDGLNTLADIVNKNFNSFFNWSHAANILVENNHQSAVSKIYVGLIYRYNSRRFAKMFPKKEVDITIKAITNLVKDPSDKKEFIEKFISSDDKKLKDMAIRACGKWGDSDVKTVLKKRLGSFYAKLEKDDFLRSLLKSSIQDINNKSR